MITFPSANFFEAVEEESEWRAWVMLVIVEIIWVIIVGHRLTTVVYLTYLSSDEVAASRIPYAKLLRG